MDGAMARMHSGMGAAARVTGNADQNGLAMMIPRYQDAAKAVLHGKDRLVTRLAQEILTEQALEIEYMRRLQK